MVGFPTTMDGKSWHANPGHDDEYDDNDSIHDHDIVGYPVLSNCMVLFSVTFAYCPSPVRRKNMIEGSI